MSSLDDRLGYTTYGEIKVSNVCKESYPCQHVVIYKNNKRTYCAIAIYNYFIKHKIPVPEHFKYIKKYLSDRKK